MPAPRGPTRDHRSGRNAMTPRLRNVLTSCLPLALALAGPAPRAQTTPAAPESRGRSGVEFPSRHAFTLCRRHPRARRRGPRGSGGRARIGAAPGAHPKAGLPAKAVPYAATLQQAASRVTQATDIASAGMSAATMLGTCGECHRTVGAMPAVDVRPAPSVGQTVGHMLAHERAVEQLMQGLVVPSSTSWNAGAQALRTAPLGRGKLPKRIRS